LLALLSVGVILICLVEYAAGFFGLGFGNLELDVTERVSERPGHVDRLGIRQKCHWSVVMLVVASGGVAVPGIVSFSEDGINLRQAFAHGRHFRLFSNGAHFDFHLAPIW
jgi:hypothetical protein